MVRVTDKPTEHSNLLKVLLLYDHRCTRERYRIAKIREASGEIEGRKLTPLTCLYSLTERCMIFCIANRTCAHDNAEISRGSAS